MANYAALGGLASGFSQGLSSGMQMGNAYNESKQRKRRKRIQEEGMQQAREQRQSDIDSQVSPAFEGGKPLGYQDESGKIYADRSEATKVAASDVKPVMDYYMENTAPKMQQMYLEQGDIEKATAWENWVNQRQVQQGMKKWASALKSAQVGDHQGFAENLKDAYNAGGYFDDGSQAKAVKPNKDKDGNVSGYSVTIESQDGTETTTDVGMDEMYNLGLGMLAPEKVFEIGYEELKSAQSMQAKAARDDYESTRDYKQKVQLEGIKSSNRMEEARVDQQLEQAGGGETRQKFNANVSILREQGFGDDEIKDLTPRILGISNTRAGASDRDLRLNALKMLTGDYMSRRNFEGLPEQEQEKKINAIVDMIKATQN